MCPDQPRRAAGATPSIVGGHRAPGRAAPTRFGVRGAVATATAPLELPRGVAGGNRRATRRRARGKGWGSRLGGRGPPDLGRAVHVQPGGPGRGGGTRHPRPAGGGPRAPRRRRRLDRRHARGAGGHRRRPHDRRAAHQRRPVGRPQLGPRGRHVPVGRVHRRRRRGPARLGGRLRRPRRRRLGRHRLLRRPVRRRRRQRPVLERADHAGGAVRRRRGLDPGRDVRRAHRAGPPSRGLPRRSRHPPPDRAVPAPAGAGRARGPAGGQRSRPADQHRGPAGHQPPGREPPSPLRRHPLDHGPSPGALPAADRG